VSLAASLVGSVQPAAGQQQPVRVTVPPVVVTAQKEPADGQSLPISVTAVQKTTLEDAGIGELSDASIFAPNTFFSEFTARKLSFPHFRGISSGPGNPAISTYVDGVPQLHTNASSLELFVVEQLELVRGGQSALVGRNALGGLIAVSSTRPSLTSWTGSLRVPIGNYGAREVRGGVSGPVSPRVAISATAGRSDRDGFTTNAITGHTLDDRSSSGGKVQLLWTPTDKWEARAIVSGEAARDGDYALQDLATLRAAPFRAARDFEGFTNRDVVSATFLTRHAGARLNVSTTTGVVRWKTEDATDLDYSPLPLVRRTNAEDAVQFTQEVRLASASTPVKVSDSMSLRWQSGVFFFTQGYEQDATNAFAPFVLDPRVGFAVDQHSPEASLDDSGVGVYGQTTMTFGRGFDLTVGARVDHERKNATLDTFFTPAFAPSTSVDAEKSFSSVSPNVAASYRLDPSRMIYGSVGRGFKAGGFNAASPRGSESFDEEHAWHTEGGLKSSWAEGRMVLNLAAFHIRWEDMQLNVPNPQVPAQFYIANVGAARSSGVELELKARPAASLDLFGAVGYTHARFGDGSTSSGVNVAGNDLPSTPDYTVSFGAQYSYNFNGRLTAYGRAEATTLGSFFYDDFNTGKQDAYSLANFRAGVRRQMVFVETWVKNAFDTEYVPLAFQFGSPSGFLGEMGAPRTFGVTFGVTF
jgi:iron complex outermembrane receptor protein